VWVIREPSTENYLLFQLGICMSQLEIQQGYLLLANRGFSDIRRLIGYKEHFQALEIADSLHNLGDWHATGVSLEALVKDFPTRENRELLELFRAIPIE
jgi:hypothetical protein